MHSIHTTYRRDRDSLVAQLVKNLLAMQETPVQFLGQEYSWAFLVVQTVKNPPAMWESWVQSPGLEDLLEKGTATHSSILAWRVPWTLYSMGSQRVGHN